jgi:hypothetical protein
MGGLGAQIVPKPVSGAVFRRVPAIALEKVVPKSKLIKVDDEAGNVI